MDSKILINDVENFDGKEEKTVRGNVLIGNNLIEKISQTPIPVEPAAGTQVPDGKGRFLIPGLIGAHWHAYLCCNTVQDLLSAEPSYTHLVAGREAEATLHRGFATIRDAGGPVSGSNGPSAPACQRGRASTPAAPTKDRIAGNSRRQGRESAHATY